MKPIALYYNILQYQKKNIDLLNKYFDVIVRENPSQSTDEDYNKANIIFAPLGYMVNSNVINRCRDLKVIASNTTGIPHIDVAAAAEKDINICALHNEQKFLDNLNSSDKCITQ